MKLSFALLLFHMGITFNSQTLDSNFYFFSTRFYDSKAGRFLSADPVVPEVQSNKGLSRYTYVYNNPVQFDDPDGHVPNDRSREVRTYDEALEDYSNQQLAGLGYTDSWQGSEEDRGALTGSQVGHAVTFGAREALRFKFVPRNVSSGASARILNVVGNSMDNILLNLALGKLGFESKVRYFYDAETLFSVVDAGLDADVAQSLAYRLDEGELPKYHTQRSVRSPFRLGLRAGATQTSLLHAPKLTYLSIATQQGFIWGSKVPVILNFGSGGFGLWSALHYENDLTQAAGVLGSGLEITASASALHNTPRILQGSLISRSRAAFKMAALRTVSLAGGVITLAAAMIEYAASQDHPPPTEEGLRYRELHPDLGFKKINGEPFEGCKGNYCLVEGTLVWTSSGLRRIEELAIGDFVLSPEGRARIVFVSKNEVDSWLQVKISQEVLSLTANHPLEVENHGWILAGEVEVSDRLSKGHEVLEIQEFEGLVKVYNLLTEPTNEFYVGSSRILVRGLAR